jgi:hypothetical protein
MANALGTATALTGNANSLASAAYISLGVIDFTAAPPSECLIEVSVQASAATAGNQQVVVYIRDSLDGTNFSVAPSATQYQNAIALPAIKLFDTTAVRSRAFPISVYFGGGLPQKIEVFLLNDCGVALAAAGQVGQYRTETFG